MSVCFFCTPFPCGCGDPVKGWVAKYKYVRGGKTKVISRFGQKTLRWVPNSIIHRVGDNRLSKCGAALFSKKRLSAIPVGTVPCKQCFEPVELPYPRKGIVEAL